MSHCRIDFKIDNNKCLEGNPSPNTISPLSLLQEKVMVSLYINVLPGAKDAINKFIEK